MTSFDENFCPPRQTLSLGNRKKSLEARSGEYGGWSISSNCNSLILAMATAEV